MLISHCYVNLIRIIYRSEKGHGSNGIAGTIIIVIVLPLLLSSLFLSQKRAKRRAVPVEVGGEAGFAMRNKKFESLVKVPWEGATTMASLFEDSCKKYKQEMFLGTRKLISREVTVSNNGRKFEKLHLGEYEWMSYGVVFERACNFASGLVKLGHNPESSAAIFAETKAEWFIAFQGVLMSHENIVATAAAVMTIVPRIGIGDVYLAYLPLDHFLN